MRGLLRPFDESDAARHVTPPAAPASAASAPAQVSSAPVQNQNTPARVNTVTGDMLELPLAPIIAALSMDLKAKLMATPPAGQMIQLPVDPIVTQLGFGSVKISFGELRQSAPGVFANSGGEHDTRQVSLPLAEILSRINPGLLARRSAQKVEVPDEVAGPFDGRGRGVTFTSQPLKPPTATPTAVPPPAGLHHPAPAAPQIKPPAAHRMAAPDTESFAFTPRQTTPAASSIPFPPTAKPADKTPEPATSHGNGTNGNGNGNGHVAPGLPPFKFSAAPVSPAPAASSAPRPEPAQPTPSPLKLTASLNDLAENWPDTVKQEIVLTLANASVALPGALIEPGLKRGRVTLSWKELRTFAKPTSAPSENDGLMLDLPLKVLAPLYLAALKKNGAAQSKVAVSAEIPNLFFGFPQAAPATVAEPAPVVPVAPVAPLTSIAPVAPVFSVPPVSSVAPVAPVAAIAALPKPAADTNFFSSHETENLRMAPATDFKSRQLHPKEVVARAMTMPGVAGAVVSLGDGLRVASEVPADLNPDTVAAFLPQIYDRVNQSTRELRMGSLNNVSFTVGNVPWKIFRINSIYFAAFGRAGEVLPKAQLAALAAELDRKK